VSTAGYNEQVVRRYIRNQEKADKASDFADLFNRSYYLIAKLLLAVQAQRFKPPPLVEVMI
jgi:hypothetical protein